MKLRRLMQIARRGQSLPKGSVVRHSKIAPPMTGSGQTRPSSAIDAMSPLPRIAAVMPQRPRTAETCHLLTRAVQ